MSLLEASAISFKRQQQTLLHDIHLTLNAGELIGLIGPNGAGKSTLLKILAGLQTPHSGSVKFQNQILTKLDAKERSQKLAWLAQGGSIHWPLSVERLVALGRLPHLAAWQPISPSDQAAIEHAIQQTGIEHLRTRDATTLSGGERTRVLLARALAAEPIVLLADEPIAALDPGYQLQTLELLRVFSQGKRACIVVLHELSLAARYCDRLYLLKSGCIVDTGSVTKVLSAENLKTVYHIECEIGCAKVPWIIPSRYLYN
ncbi:MAG: Hemin import ATP-binding protein HmuV [Pseudomonadota bacterium]|jgi:iron complex transport system ATP-binding protein